MSLQQKIEKNWTDSAADYSSSVQGELQNASGKQVWTDLILSHAPKTGTLDILDIGTGPGFFAIIMSLAGHRVTAIDCTEKMVEEAKRNAQREGVHPRFSVSDGHELAFPDESFDLIISRNVTWTLIDAEKAYTEWKRVLRPNGKVIIFDANWNLRYFDEEYMRGYEEDERNYQAIYKKPVHEYTEEMHEYRKSMPMCRRLRPQWDFETFMKLGYKTFYCDIEVSEKVWDEETKVKYRSTPMFMLAAGK